MPYDRDFHYDSEAAFDREGAREVGRAHPDRAWILSDRDCWYSNPFYTGPKVPHPEDDDADEETDGVERKPLRPGDGDDIPF